MAVIISPSLLLTTPPDIPGFNQNNPAILYRNFFRLGDTDASSEVDPNFRENAYDGLTWDFWEPESLPATLEVELPSPRDGDGAGITFSRQQPEGITVEWQYWDGSDWETVADYNTAARVSMALFEEVEAARWRVRLSGSGDPPKVADVTIGNTLRLERRIYQGFTPNKFAIATEYAVNRSRNGQRLGATVVREGITNSVTVDNLSGDWVHENMPPLIEHIRRTLPVYFAWRPLDFPDDVIFCWGDGDVRPTNTGPRDLMSFDWSYVGVGPDTQDGQQT